jgi:hypothetical protein
MESVRDRLPDLNSVLSQLNVMTPDKSILVCSVNSFAVHGDRSLSDGHMMMYLQNDIAILCHNDNLYLKCE